MCKRILNNTLTQRVVYFNPPVYEIIFIDYNDNNLLHGNELQVKNYIVYTYFLLFYELLSSSSGATANIIYC